MMDRKEPERTPDLARYFRRSSLEAQNLPRGRVEWMVAEGIAERVGYGLYRRTDLPPTPLDSVLRVAAAVPEGIVCLLTALRIHEIGTQSPTDVWLALDHKARAPKLSNLPVRLVRWSGRMLRYAVEDLEIDGVRMRLTTPARTVVDCFRYRNKIGLDIAIEALSSSIESRKATVDEIVRAADVCRARTIIKPYLEAVLGS